MARPGRKPRIDLECQAHVYMTRETYDFIEAKAKAEFRSINGQVQKYVAMGIEAERAASPPDPAKQDAVSAGQHASEGE